MRLADLVGQDRAIGMISRAIERGRLPHAYLFDGPEGVGKRTAALALGAALVCTNAPGQGCGLCAACGRVEASHHPDVRTFAATGAQIKVETAQEIVALASERPHEAPARVVILEDADLLNPNAANCLLKTLEEPAPANHIVLVSAAPDRLLGTIRSRTQRVRFSPLPTEVVRTWIERRGVERARAEVVAALCDGSLARALALLEQDEADSPWQTIERLRGTAAHGDMSAIMDAAAAVAGKEERSNLGEVLTLLGRFYRDVLVTAAAAPELVVLGERRSEMEAPAARARAHHALLPARRALGAVLEAEQDLAANVNATTATEALLLRLRSLERAPQPRQERTRP